MKRVPTLMYEAEFQDFLDRQKKAVEEIFKVEVEKVTTINYKGKPKRQGVFYGKRADWKKAVVKLTPSSKTIELFEA